MMSIARPARPASVPACRSQGKRQARARLRIQRTGDGHRWSHALSERGALPVTVTICEDGMHPARPVLMADCAHDPHFHYPKTASDSLSNRVRCVTTLRNFHSSPPVRRLGSSASPHALLTMRRRLFCHLCSTPGGEALCWIARQQELFQNWQQIGRNFSSNFAS